MPSVIIDTGPLVAFLSERDEAHEWTLNRLAGIAYPLLTCEAVLSETCFLLNRRYALQAHIVFEMLSDGLITIPFHAADHAEAIQGLIRKYADVPMSFADACLVRMAELHDESIIVTLDSDFHVYRKHGRQRLDVIMPET